MVESLFLPICSHSSSPARGTMLFWKENYGSRWGKLNIENIHIVFGGGGDILQGVSFVCI